MLGICLSVTDRHIWSKYFLHILLFVNNCSQLKYLAIGKLFWKSTWSLLYDNRICACNQCKSYMTCILLCYKEIIVYNDVKIIMIPEQGVHLENKNRLNDNRNLILSLGMICLHDQLITSLSYMPTIPIFAGFSRFHVVKNTNPDIPIGIVKIPRNPDSQKIQPVLRQ